MGCFGDCLCFKRHRAIAIMPVTQSTDQPHLAKDLNIFCVTNSKSTTPKPVEKGSTSGTTVINVRPVASNEQQQCFNIKAPVNPASQQPNTDKTPNLDKKAISFDIVLDGPKSGAAPPDRLQPRECSYNRGVTTRQIKEKLLKADMRRIEEERKRIEKIRTSCQKREEQKAREILKNCGLIEKPTAVTPFAVGYEIVEKIPKSALPPERFDSMKYKKVVELTEEEIKEKLAEAERRRKAREEERILKIRAMEKTEPAEVIEAFKQKQKLKEEEFTKKMNEVVAARAKRLRDIRDDLKKKDKHAKLVRARKDLNLDDMDPVNGSPSKLPNN